MAATLFPQYRPPSKQDSSNPFLNPADDLKDYTENFKEFPITVSETLPYFHTAIYKIAVIKSVEQLIIAALSNAHSVATECLGRVQNTFSSNIKQCEEAIQHGLIRPCANAMQPVINIHLFHQKLCWTLSEFNSRAGLQIPTEQLSAISTILTDDNISVVLDQVAAKSCKAAFAIIENLVKATIAAKTQSLQSAKVMYGSYLSPISPSASSMVPSEKPFLPASTATASVSEAAYPTVKNVPLEYASRHFRSSAPTPTAFASASRGFASLSSASLFSNGDTAATSSSNETPYSAVKNIPREYVNRPLHSSSLHPTTPLSSRGFQSSVFNFPTGNDFSLQY